MPVEASSPLTLTDCAWLKALRFLRCQKSSLSFQTLWRLELHKDDVLDVSGGRTVKIYAVFDLVTVAECELG